MTNINLSTPFDKYRQIIKFDTLNYFFYFQKGTMLLSVDDPSYHDYLKCALDDLLYIKPECYTTTICVDKLSL